ncbi:MAG: SURF1 family protein [Bacteroidetes bacterium]|jgi:surfeit locus 1 family protein|nr:SURF1 family protein [Bacteroidota bacterium]
MKLRPLFWPTMVAFPALLVLLYLGTWQVQRLEWKNQLIEDFESRANALPIDLPQGKVPSELEFRRLALTGSFDHTKEVFLTGRTYEGNAGFHIVTPFTLDDGRIVLVNRGWVSESYRDQAKRPFTLIDGVTTVPAILRFPATKGYFVPENEPDNGFWFTLIPDQIVNHLGLQGQAETAIYADILRASDEVRLPIAARTKTNLRNSHLGYAITWYGIACALIGVYLAFHHQAGRLRFGRAKDGN